MKTSRQPDGRDVIDLATAVVVVFAVFGCVVLLLVPSKGDQPGSAAGAARASLLTARGYWLLPVPDDLSPYVGQNAKGQRIEVQSVIDGEGFWIGWSRTQSVYVTYDRQIGDNAPTFVPSVGDNINVTGAVRRAPDDPARTLRLKPPDDQRVRRQGAYISADRAERAS